MQRGDKKITVKISCMILIVAEDYGIFEVLVQHPAILPSTGQHNHNFIGKEQPDTGDNTL